MSKSLVNAKGVKSLRNVDYTTYYALAELIDNSLQWGADHVRVIVIQEEQLIRKRRTSRIKEIIIYDNGDGMSRGTLDICLQYGGGENGPTSKEMGKFGMGLPNASGSQSSRTEVYSWQNNVCYFNVLDFDELEGQDDPRIPSAKKKALPPYIKKLVGKRIKASGTAVVWKNCDQLNHKTVAAIHRNLEFFLGRIYRHWIHTEKKKITFSAYERSGNKIDALPDRDAQIIRVMDPLFLMTPNLVRGFEEVALNDARAGVDKVSTNDGEYDVRIKFSIAKAETQEREGGTGGLGQSTYRKLVGISLVRAGRELKHHDFGFVDNKNDYMHRWWSCEVSFGPELDELFGVTNDKQEARAFRNIEEEEYKDRREGFEDETLELMYQISKLINANIKTLIKEIKNRKKGSKTKVKCPACHAWIVMKNRTCPECKAKMEYCPHHPAIAIVAGECALCITSPDVPDTMCTKHNMPLVQGECDQCKKTKAPLSSEEQLALKEFLTINYRKFADDAELLATATKHYLQSGRSHFIIYVSTPSATFVMPQVFGDVTIIAVNTTHPFYERYMRPMIEERDEVNEILPIHLLLGAMVSAEQGDYANAEVHELFRETMGLNLKQLMQAYDLD